MIEAIKKRRAIREYLDEKVSEEKLNAILDSAMYAPSANAKYPWDLVVIRDEGMREDLSKVSPWALHIKNAPVVIAIVGYENESKDWVEDCSIVAEHIWLEAVNQDLGACWVQIRGNENAQKDVKEILNVPDEYRVLCLMSIGVPAVKEEEHNPEDFDKSKIKQEKY